MPGVDLQQPGAIMGWPDGLDSSAYSMHAAQTASGAGVGTTQQHQQQQTLRTNSPSIESGTSTAPTTSATPPSSFDSYPVSRTQLFSNSSISSNSTKRAASGGGGGDGAQSSAGGGGGGVFSEHSSVTNSFGLASAGTSSSNSGGVFDTHTWPAPYCGNIGDSGTPHNNINNAGVPHRWIQQHRSAHHHAAMRAGQVSESVLVAINTAVCCLLFLQRKAVGCVLPLSVGTLVCLSRAVGRYCTRFNAPLCCRRCSIPHRVSTLYNTKLFACSGPHQRSD